MIRQRVSICREGLYYLGMMLFIVAGAQIREVNLLMFIAAIMVGPLLISWRMVYVMLSKLTVTRHLPDRCTAGDAITVELRAHNARRRLPCWAITLTDHVTMPEMPDADRPDPPQPIQVFLREVPRQGTATARYTLRPMDRGRYQFGPLNLETRFPLGLIRRRITRNQEHRLIVHPSRGRLISNWRQALRSPREGTQQASHRIGLLEGDFHAFRDWQAGDSRRWIHWRTSARRGQLTVRQFEQQTDQDVVLLVDLTTDHAGDRGSNHELEQFVAREQAIRFAATVATAVCRNASQRITIGIAGKTMRHVAGTGSLGILYEILEQLALAQPSHATRLTELVQAVAPGLGTRQPVWLVTPQAIPASRQQEIAAILERSSGETEGGLLQIISVNSPLWNEIFDDSDSGLTRHAT